MAKTTPKTKKEKLENDEMLFDADLDFGDFNFDADEPADDRSAVTAFTSSAAESTINHLKENLVRDSIKEALPKGYGEALNVVDQGTSSLRTLYDTAEKEFKPIKKDLQRITKKVLPKVEDKLPKSIAEKLKAFSDVDNDSPKRDYQEEMLTSTLGEIFGRFEQQQSQQEFLEVAEQKRFNNQIFQLDEIRKSSRILSEYQRTTGLAYHRRSLELQYRHYFVAQQTLEETKRTFAMQETAFKVIAKNTGLPEFAKLRNSERFQEHLRNRFIDKTLSTLSGRNSNFIPNMFKNLTDTAIEKIKSTASSIGSGVSQGLMGAEMMADGGPRPAELGGSIAGSLLGSQISSSLTKHVIKPLADKSPGVKKFGNKLSYLIGNAASLSKDWSQNTGYEYGLKGDLQDIATSAIQRSLDANTNVTATSVKDLDVPKEFSVMDSRSLTEIIPGLLSRIQREIKILRTGDEKTPLIRFDVTTGKFLDEGAITASIATKYFNKSNQEHAQRKAQSVIDMIDPDGTKLTPEQRKQISMDLAQMSVTNRTGSQKNLTSSGNWSKDGEQISELFTQFFKDDEFGEKKLKMASHVRTVAEGLDLDHQEIQAYINAGYGEHLTQLGIIKDGRINYKEYVRRLMSGDFPTLEEIKEGTTAANNGKKVVIKQGKQVHHHKTVNKTVNSSVNDQSVHSTTNVNFDPMLELLKAQNVRPEVVSIEESIKKIEELVRGISEKGVGTHFDGIDFNTIRDKFKNKKFFDKSIKEHLSGLMDTGMAVAGRTKDTLMWGGRHAINTMRFGMDKGLGIAKAVGRKALGLLPDLTEIHIPGRDKAVMTYQKFRDGVYTSSIDPKLKITNLKTLKKAIELGGQILDTSEVDPDGNPKVVCDVQELKDAVIIKKDKAMQKITAALGIGKDYFMKGVSILGRRAKDMLNLSQTAINVAKRISALGMKTAKNLMDPPSDIYVVGESEPRLFANIMKAGGYISKKTGKPIHHPNGIDGEVLLDGNIVISFEDIGKGLVTAKGRKLRPGSTLVGRLAAAGAQFAGKAIGTAWTALKKGAQLTKDFLGGGMRVAAQFVKGVFGEGFILSTKHTLTVLEQIRDILDERLPGKKKVFGDKDGDGIRDNSVEDLGNKRKAAMSEKLKDKIAAAGTAASGFGSGLKEKWKGWLNSKKEKERENGEEEEKDDGSLLDDAADLAEIGDFANGDGHEGKGRRDKGKGRVKGKGKIKPTKGGRIGRALKATGRGAGKLVTAPFKVAGKAAGMAGRGAMGLGRMAGRGLGAAGRLFRGVPGGGATGALALAGGAAAAYSVMNDDSLAISEKNTALMDIGGATAGGLAGASIGAGIGSIVPVVGTVIGGLAGGVIGGLIGSGIGSGIGNMLFNKSLGEMATLRYVQYGFSPDDKRYTQPIYDLEQMMQKAVVKNPNGIALDVAKINPNDMMKLFGRELSDTKGANAWAQWMLGRFKPVFLAHLNALMKIKPDVKLDDVDSKLSDAEKYRFLASVSIPNTVYTMLSSPVKELPQLTITPSVAMKYMDTLKAKYKEAADKEKKDPTIAGKVGAATTAAAAGTAVVMKDKPTTEQDKSKQGKPVDPFNPAVPGVAAAAGITLTATGEMVVNSKDKVSDLESVFMKTVGVTVIEPSKTQSIRRLTAVVLKSTVLQNKKATFNGSPETVYKQVCAEFGCDPNNELHKELFTKWLVNRYLPVYLNLATSLAQTTNDIKNVVALDKVTGDNALTAAIVMNGTVYNTSASAQSVWGYDIGPWPDYALNKSMTSVEGHVNALKNSIGTASVKNAIKDATAKKSNSVMDSMSKMMNSLGDKIGSAYNGAKSAVKDAVATVGAAADRAWNGAKQTYGNVKTAIGNAMDSARETVDNVAGNLGFDGGTIGQHVGNGTGGDINSIPNPTGPEGKYESVRAMLEAVAKMTGVDIKILAAMAAKESSFRWSIKAGSSSATGLYQFLGRTWREVLKKYGPKYGINPNTSPKDPRANALMGAEYIKENLAGLKKYRPNGVSATDAYIAHFLGPGDAQRFFKAGPDAIGAAVFPAPAKSNPDVFYSGGRPRTLGEIYQLFKGQVEGKMDKYGPSGTPAPKPAAPVAGNGAKPPAPNAQSTPVASTATPSPNVPTQNMVAPKGPTPGITKGNIPPVAAPAAPTPTSPAYTAAATKTQVESKVADQKASVNELSGILTETLLEQRKQTQLLTDQNNLFKQLIASFDAKQNQTTQESSKSMSPRQPRNLESLPKQPVSFEKKL